MGLLYTEANSGQLAFSADHTTARQGWIEKQHKNKIVKKKKENYLQNMRFIGNRFHWCGPICGENYRGYTRKCIEHGSSFGWWGGRDGLVRSKVTPG